MLSDIEIAQGAKMLPIAQVAEQLGIQSDELEFYGKYKAKLSDELAHRLESEPDGKLILVTAINPTPAGEGRPPRRLDWDRPWPSWAKRPCWR